MSDFTNAVQERINALQELNSRLNVLEEVRESAKTYGGDFNIRIYADGTGYRLPQLVDSHDIIRTINTLLAQQIDEKIESLKLRLSKEPNAGIADPAKEDT